MNTLFGGGQPRCTPCHARQMPASRRLRASRMHPTCRGLNPCFHPPGILPLRSLSTLPLCTNSKSSWRVLVRLLPLHNLASLHFCLPASGSNRFGRMIPHPSCLTPPPHPFVVRPAYCCWPPASAPPSQPAGLAGAPLLVFALRLPFCSMPAPAMNGLTTRCPAVPKFQPLLSLRCRGWQGSHPASSAPCFVASAGQPAWRASSPLFSRPTAIAHLPPKTPLVSTNHSSWVPHACPQASA